MSGQLIFFGCIWSGLALFAYSQNPAGPSWWYAGDPPAVEQGVEGVDNYAIANVGQGKWMTLRALDSIQDIPTATAARAAIIPFIFSDQAPSPEEQEKNSSPLNLGQLKAMAKPIYDELNKIQPEWVQGELLGNQVTSFQALAGLNPSWGYVEGGYYPWDPLKTLEDVKAPANLGQLKAVFSLDFTIDLHSDFDGDGLTDWYEDFVLFSDSTNPDTDVDGVSDGDELILGSDPNSYNDWDNDPQFDDNPVVNPPAGVFLASLEGDSDQNVEKTLTKIFTLPAGNSQYLAVVMVESDEFPKWTGESSEFNDTYEVEIKRNGISIASVAGEVNPLHGEWLAAAAKGEDFFGYRPPAYVETEIVEADEAADRAIEVTMKITNISDGTLPTSVVVALLPVDIVPDWDRDGMITDEDSGKASDENPFIFWINNDDDDNPEPEWGDIPQAQMDGNDMAVNSERDLVDFFPVELRIKEILEVLSPDEYTYKISHPTGAFHFIEMPMVQPNSQRINGAGSYLADETSAAEAMARPMKDTAGDGSELSDDYLDAVKNGMGVLLFESTSATNQSFELIITKNGGGEVARVSRALPVELVDVEEMFWRANIRPAAYGQQVPATIPPVNTKFKESRKDRWFVFCHGYNVSAERARGWNAEVFKRLHQMGADAKFLGVTWEGNQGQISESIPLLGGKTPDYWQNVYNAFRSSSALSVLVNGLSGGDKVIAGHSLGNMLVSSAICDHGLDAEQYFMLNAAVAREAYAASHVQDDRASVRNERWKNYATRLWPTDYWNLGFAANDGRRKLTWQGRFSTLAAHTSPYNYHSTGEEVLKSGDGTTPGLLTDIIFKGEGAWVKGEMGKGEATKAFATGATNGNWVSSGGWGFNSGAYLSYLPNPLDPPGTPPTNDPNTLTNAQLRATPFFKPFRTFNGQNGNAQSIHGANGSALANDYGIRSFLLGHDLPALSNPAGSKPIVGYAGVDMAADLKTGTWGNWKHSDLKNQPMGRVWKLFSDMVSRGDLNDRFTPPPTN